MHATGERNDIKNLDKDKTTKYSHHVAHHNIMTRAFPINSHPNTFYSNSPAPTPHTHAHSQQPEQRDGKRANTHRAENRVRAKTSER
jgi:hypothetical protein